MALRPFVSSDAPLLLGWVLDRAAMLMWAGPTFEWPPNLAQLEAAATEADRRSWTVIDVSEDTVGHISLGLGGDGTGRLSRVLVSPEARGRGIASAMVPLVLAEAFGPLGLESVTLGVFEHNAGARGIYERLGFTTYDVLNDIETVDGIGWTALQMRLTKPNAG